MNSVLKIILLLLFYYLSKATEVPKKLIYAGIELEFSEKVRKEIQKYVDFIEKNPLALKSMVERASIFFPIIEEAFTYVGTPKDLMYISIQESGLRGNAISSSLAVGYWQLKDFTAKEVGLTINNYIDERRHIYRASVAAALYFLKQNIRFDNWLYAVIAYYEGGTGAEPYTQNKYIGAKKMFLNSLHWYAEKAIAHKLVYEKILKYPNNNKWLQAKPINLYKSFSYLIQKENISKENFKKYNPWLLKEKYPEYNISFYVLKTNTPYNYKGDPYKNFNDFLVNKYKSRIPKPLLTQNTTKKEEKKENNTHYKEITFKRHKSKKKIRKKANPLPPKNIAVFYIEKEPLYGKEFVIIKPNETLEKIANKYGVKLRKLRKWNNLSKYEKPETNTIIYLVPPKKASIHIVGKYETLYDIALFHKKKVNKLVQYNRLKSEKDVIYYGQKIYLKEKKPIDEKLIIYSFEKKPILRSFVLKNREKNSKDFIIHVVKKGETLWQISRKYNINIDKIREINNLRSNIIQEGMKLKIPKK